MKMFDIVHHEMYDKKMFDIIYFDMVSDICTEKYLNIVYK